MGAAQTLARQHQDEQDRDLHDRHRRDQAGSTISATNSRSSAPTPMRDAAVGSAAVTRRQ
jgi:hypothetical protein